MPSHAKKYNRLLKDRVYSFVFNYLLFYLLIQFIYSLKILKLDFYHCYYKSTIVFGIFTGTLVLPCVLNMWIIIKSLLNISKQWFKGNTVKFVLVLNK